MILLLSMNWKTCLDKKNCTHASSFYSFKIILKKKPFSCIWLKYGHLTTTKKKLGGCVWVSSLATNLWSKEVGGVKGFLGWSSWGFDWEGATYGHHVFQWLGPCCLGSFWLCFHILSMVGYVYGLVFCWKFQKLVLMMMGLV